MIIRKYFATMLVELTCLRSPTREIKIQVDANHSIRREETILDPLLQ